MTQVASRRIYPTHESVHFLIFIHAPVVNATAASPDCHFATRGGRRHVLGGHVSPQHRVSDAALSMENGKCGVSFHS